MWFYLLVKLLGFCAGISLFAAIVHTLILFPCVFDDGFFKTIFTYYFYMFLALLHFNLPFFLTNIFKIEPVYGLFILLFNTVIVFKAANIYDKRKAER